MKLFPTNLTALLLMVVLFAFSSCQNEKGELDSNTTTDNANSQSAFDDVFKLAEDVLTKNDHVKLAAGSSPAMNVNCTTVDSISLGTNHVSFLITFNSNCQSYDGKTRSGQLFVELNGASFNTPGAVLTIKSLSYTVEGIKINGKKTITCVTGGSNPVHNIVVSDTTTGADYAQIFYPNGKTAQWKAHYTRSLVSGNSIGTLVFDISTTPALGNPSFEGVNREGRHYTVTINSPIRLDFNCFSSGTARYPTQGILDIHPDGRLTRSVDYGNGACDNKIKVKVGKRTYDITLAY